MANNATNVSVGKPKGDGAIFSAPKGTAIPTDGTSPLDATFKTLGYIHEDGVTNAIETDSEDIKAWGGDTVLTFQTSYKETFQFQGIETNEETLKAYYGDDNVAVAESNISVNHSPEELGERVWVIETILSGGKVRRDVIPNGKVTERGELVLKDDEPIGYDMTISALPDESGYTAYTFIATAV